MNDEIKMSRMAGVAATMLGATQQAVMSQMQKFSMAEDKKQSQMNARTIERERREDISSRNSVDEIDPYQDMPEEAAPAEPRGFKKVDDSATAEEIELFAYALSLGSALADSSKIDSMDIIRADDFSGDTLKVLVGNFLKIFDGRKETLFAKMSDYFSRLTINGQRAEDVMLRAVENADKSINVDVKRDMYLTLLCKVRTGIINKEEENLIRMRASASDADKAKIDEMLRRLSDYKLELRNKIGEL
jgi:hypothetical protein